MNDMTTWQPDNQRFPDRGNAAIKSYDPGSGCNHKPDGSLDPCHTEIETLEPGAGSCAAPMGFTIARKVRHSAAIGRDASWTPVPEGAPMGPLPLLRMEALQASGT